MAPDGDSTQVEEAGDWIASQLLARPGVDERKSRFADKSALFFRGKEFFHLDAVGLADVRLGRRLIRAHREELRSDSRVELGSESDWINVRFASREDAEVVVQWAEMAINAGG